MFYEAREELNREIRTDERLMAISGILNRVPSVHKYLKPRLEKGINSFLESYPYAPVMQTGGGLSDFDLGLDLGDDVPKFELTGISNKVTRSDDRSIKHGMTEIFKSLGSREFQVGESWDINF